MKTFTKYNIKGHINKSHSIFPLLIVPWLLLDVPNKWALIFRFKHTVMAIQYIEENEKPIG